ncbi:transcriptional regulator [Streptomyces tateyamensis]|uniref:Transcriptional regulator n=1 Tax=Streptomyces tateyamensis TaxID=565073 RepID=A0A2V4MTH9_9ACTN|nr:Scr1 family TA system antitoxin-like transcriptional regulator [Streptomyces tateyamensis]PYC67365.1 transcriptional regulator [Streptomyces tateyamensis]
MPTGRSSEHLPLTPESFGWLLRDWRRLRGVKNAALAREFKCHDSLLSRFEGAQRKPHREYVEWVDHRLDAGGALVRAFEEVDWDREAVHPDWFQRYAGLEEKADLIRGYDLKRLPGLLQTPEYARALFRFARPEATDEQLANSIAARMSRRRRFLKADGPQLVQVLDEGIIWSPVGGLTAMREQLQHVLDLGERPNIVVQVAPFSLGERGGPTSGFTLLTLPGGEQWAYSESMSKGYFANDHDTIKARSRSYDRLRAESLSASDTARLIRRAMRGLVNVPISFPSQHLTYSFQKAAWRKSTYSDGDGGQCVEVALNLAPVVPVRDSKDRHGPQLNFPSSAWASFVRGVAAGEFDAS